MYDVACKYKVDKYIVHCAEVKPDPFLLKKKCVKQPPGAYAGIQHTQRRVPGKPA